MTTDEFILIRKKNKLTQYQFAYLLKISHSMVSKIELESHNISSKVLDRINSFTEDDVKDAIFNAKKPYSDEANLERYYDGIPRNISSILNDNSSKILKFTLENELLTKLNGLTRFMLAQRIKNK